MGSTFILWRLQVIWFIYVTESQSFYDAGRFVTGEVPAKNWTIYGCSIWNVVSIFDAESDRQTHSLQVWIAALYFTKFLTVSLICLPEKSVLYCHKLLLIRQHNVLNLYRATPQRCTLFVGIQMEIIWLQSVKSLWECGHYRLGSAFTSSVLVETCSILVFSIQATPLSWSLEATRWVCFYDVNVELCSNFV